MVNRIWRWHFGQGLVAHDRQLRPAGRSPVASRAARLAGPALHRRRLVDEDNAPADHALQHVPDEQRPTMAMRPQSTRRTDCSGGSDVRRLEAEAMRDALLAVSGTLDRDDGRVAAAREKPRLLLRPHVEGSTRATTARAARFTCRSSATTCTTCSSCSTPPTRPCPTATGPQRPSPRRPCSCSTATSSCKSRRRPGRPAARRITSDDDWQIQPAVRDCLRPPAPRPESWRRIGRFWQSLRTSLGGQRARCRQTAPPSVERVVPRRSWRPTSSSIVK